MQKIQNLIQSYKPLDFSYIDEKLLIEYPFLKQWLEDNYLLSFIESIKEEYSFFLFDYSPLLNAKVYFIPNTLLCSLEKALNALKLNEHLENLNFYLYAIEKYSNIVFYTIRYNAETKDIFLREEWVTLYRDNSSFRVTKIWEKRFIILKENSECVFKISRKEPKNKTHTTTLKTNQCHYLFNDELLKNYFLKQINTAISKDLNLLPPFTLHYLKVDFNLLKESHTIQDFVESALNLKIPFNLNKLDLFTAFSFGIFLPFIETQEQNKMYQFLINNPFEYKEEMAYTNDEYFCLLSHKRKKFHCLNLYYFYLSKQFAQQEWYKDDFCIIARDYTRLVYETKANINLKIKSTRRIEREHNALVQQLQHKREIPTKKKLKINPAFNALKLPKNFKLLKTERELFLQGEKQNNCVYTRKDKVNRGTSAIYHLDYQGDYTLEISKRKEKFILYEMKGKHNVEPTEEIYSYVQKELERINANLKLLECQK